MDLSYITYPFLFITIYFECFLLVTFLSSPARKQRGKEASLHTPSVAVIVPCYNEEKTIEATIESLLALKYPKDKLTLVLVNDGSKDGTASVMDTYIGNPQITIIHKENGGKHTALNLGIEKIPQAEFFGCLDADSFVDPNALREIIGHFENPKVAAVTAAMSVHEPKTLLELMQNAEYIFGITLRHTISSVNGLYVTPGPFSFYRRSTILSLGGFQKGHNTEDLEMALRIQRAGFLIENAPRAKVYTKTPKTIPTLIKQRVRWSTGFVRNVIYEYRDLIGNPNFGTLGLVVLPLGLFAILSGISLFFIVIFQTIFNITHTLIISRGVPFSYNFIPHFHTFEWFYAPLTAIAFLTVIAMTGSVSFMLLGKKISGTSSPLALGILVYIFFYGVIAPIWLIRTVYDVLTGARRSWR
jgi:peptidoglycan-N-acetylglucosamine deacetylase